MEKKKRKRRQRHLAATHSDALFEEYAETHTEHGYDRDDKSDWQEGHSELASSVSSYGPHDVPQSKKVITVKRPGKRFGRALAIENSYTLRSITDILAIMMGVRVTAITNSSFGVITDVSQLQNGRDYIAVTRDELEEAGRVS